MPGDPGAPQKPESGGTPERGDLRDVLLVALAVTVAGVVLGLLWWQLAPTVRYISDGQNAFPRNSEGEEAIGVDGTFTLLAVAVGVVTGLLVFLFRRRGGIGVVVGLALGALLGSLLAWRLGVWLGPAQDVAAQARSVGRGGTFDAPLELAATVALLAWPLAALATHLIVTAAFGPRDPEPQPPAHPQWGPPPAK